MEKINVNYELCKSLHLEIPFFGDTPDQMETFQKDFYYTMEQAIAHARTQMVLIQPAELTFWQNSDVQYFPYFPPPLFNFEMVLSNNPTAFWNSLNNSKHTFNKIQYLVFNFSFCYSNTDTPEFVAMDKLNSIFVVFFYDPT